MGALKDVGRNKLPKEIKQSSNQAQTSKVQGSVHCT